MSERSPRTPSYRLHKPSGQAVVTLNGRDVYLGKYGTGESRIEYDRVVSEWLANGRGLPVVAVGPPTLTVNELLLAYLRFAEGYYVKNGKLTSEYACTKAAVKPLQGLYGKTPAAGFGPLSLKAVRQKMIQSDLSRKVINKNIGRLKRIFKWGVENELVPGGVSHALDAVSGLRKGRSEARENDSVKPVSDQHVEAIKAFVSLRVWAMIELQRLTGMRPGEARMMRGCDLDMRGPIWEYRPGMHKTEHHDKERLIPLGPRAQSVIRPFLNSDLTAFLFSPGDAEAARNAERRRNRKSPMTPSQEARKPRGRRFNDFYTKDAYIAAIRRACKKAGVPAWRPNQLRHASGTRVRKEFGLEAAQVWLGHSRADVTQVYAERNLELARDIAAKDG